MASVIQICNKALFMLGANRINALTEDSVEAQVCNANWDIERRAMLRLHPWNFAIRRLEIPKVDTTPAFRFKNKYALPSDCLRVLTVNENDRRQSSEFKVEERHVFTDADQCFVKYIKDVTDTGSWDSSFVEAMSARLAREMSYTLVSSHSMVEVATQIYEKKLQEAKYNDASEDIPDQFAQHDNTLVDSRFELGL